AGQSKKCGRKKVRAHFDSALKQLPVLAYLSDQKHTTQNNGENKPAEHRSAPLLPQADFRTPKREAACEQADAKYQRAFKVEFLWARSSLRMHIKVQIRENEDAKETCLRKNECKDPGLIVVGKRYLRRVWTDDWIRPIRIRDVPQWSPAANRRERVKIFMRRRRSCGPLERPCIPGVFASHFFS